MSGPVPTAIARCGAAAAGGAIEITWSDGARRVYSPRLLRDACPCATCREQRAAPRTPALLPVLSPAEVAPLAITGMRPVGQYAYAIGFSDGHSSGIYTLEYLRELA
jgi:DUF971 family protein